jgi:hypothetical protein
MKPRAPRALKAIIGRRDNQVLVRIDDNSALWMTQKAYDKMIAPPEPSFLQRLSDWYWNRKDDSKNSFDEDQSVTTQRSEPDDNVFDEIGQDNLLEKNDLTIERESTRNNVVTL